MMTKNSIFRYIKRFLSLNITQHWMRAIALRIELVAYKKVNNSFNAPLENHTLQNEMNENFRGWQLTISSTFPSTFRVCGWRYFLWMESPYHCYSYFKILYMFASWAHWVKRMETKHFHVHDMNVAYAWVNYYYRYNGDIYRWNYAWILNKREL